MIIRCPTCRRPRFDWMPSHYCSNDIVYGRKGVMTTEEFHIRRTMFVVVDGIVCITDPGDPRTHIEWFNDLYQSYARGQEVLTTCVRGYVLGTRLFAYKGEDFSHHLDLDHVLQAINVFERRGTIIDEVGFGAVPQAETPWPPRTILDIDTFRHMVKLHQKGSA